MTLFVADIVIHVANIVMLFVIYMVSSICGKVLVLQSFYNIKYQNITLLLKFLIFYPKYGIQNIDFIYFY